MPTRPSRVASPWLSITASANTRWMSRPTTLIDLPPPAVMIPGAGGQHGNYGSALAAHPGEPQGRPDNGSGSRPMVQGSACPHSRAPGAPCPGWSHHSADPDGSAGHQGTAAIMTVNSQVERMNRTLKDAAVRRYHYGSHDELRRHLQLF